MAKPNLSALFEQLDSITNAGTNAPEAGERRAALTEQSFSSVSDATKGNPSLKVVGASETASDAPGASEPDKSTPAPPQAVQGQQRPLTRDVFRACFDLYTRNPPEIDAEYWRTNAPPDYEFKDVEIPDREKWYIEHLEADYSHVLYKLIQQYGAEPIIDRLVYACYEAILDEMNRARKNIYSAEQSRNNADHTESLKE